MTRYNVEWTYVRLERYARWALNSISCMEFPQPTPLSDNRPISSVMILRALPQPRKRRKVKRRRTADPIREANIAALSPLGVGQVDIVLGQTLLAIMPFVEAWWVAATVRFGQAAQEGEEVVFIVRN